MKHLPGDFEIPKRVVSRVFLHCSASDRPEHDNPETIHEWHINRDFSMIGYHYYIDKEGSIWTGRGLEMDPAAQKWHNRGTIAICCGGLKDFTEKQMFALTTLCDEIDETYKDFGKNPVSFHGHCEVDKNKTCPVYDYKTILGLDHSGMMIRDRK